MALEQAERQALLDTARKAGVDLDALRANLALTPAERIRELVEMNRFHADIQSRSLSPRQRRILEEREIAEARERLGEDALIE